MQTQTIRDILNSAEQVLSNYEDSEKGLKQLAAGTKQLQFETWTSPNGFVHVKPIGFETPTEALANVMNGLVRVMNTHRDELLDLFEKDLESGRKHAIEELARAGTLLRSATRKSAPKTGTVPKVEEETEVIHPSPSAPSSPSAPLRNSSARVLEVMTTAPEGKSAIFTRATNARGKRAWAIFNDDLRGLISSGKVVTETVTRFNREHVFYRRAEETGSSPSATHSKSVGK